jgi:hypothetical protein
MTTSGTYSFSVSRDDIIREAMINIGKIGENDVITAQETQDCARKLNMLVKQWQAKTDFAPGLKTWTRRRGYLFLNNSTGKYSVGPTAVGWTNNFVKTYTTVYVNSGSTTITVLSTTGISVNDNIGVQFDNGELFWTTVSAINTSTNVITLAAALPSYSSANSTVFDYTTAAQQPQIIETAILRDNQNNDTPLKIMTVQEYDYLPSKTNISYNTDPGAIYYEFQLGNSLLYTDSPAATDVTKYIVLTYLETIQDFNNPKDTPEYPQDWFLPLTWGLSKQIAPMFSSPWTSEMDSIYKESLAIAQKRDPERSAMYFQCGEEI